MTPLMEFVRSRRAAKSIPQVILPSSVSLFGMAMGDLEG